MSIRAPLFFCPTLGPAKKASLALAGAICDHKGLRISPYKRSLTTCIGHSEMLEDKLCLSRSDNGREVFFPQLSDLIDRSELL